MPGYSPDMPISITHSPDSTQHILEKTVTLNVGKSRSFSFMDDYGDNVHCYINNVTLIDVWKNTEEEMSGRKLFCKKGMLKPLCANPHAPHSHLF